MAKAAKALLANSGFALLDRRLQDITRGIERGVNKVKQEAATQALNNVAANTPVDTGAARSGWVTNLGPPSRARRDPFSPIPSRWKPRKGVYPGGSKGETGNLMGALQAGKAVIERAKPEQNISIANNAPHIGPLSRGHSKQSRPGWVNRAILRAVSTVEHRVYTMMNREIS